MNRRNFVVSLCAAISAFALPFRKKKTARSNWTRVRIRRDVYTGCAVVTARHRNLSVPIGQRKKYAVGYWVEEERLEDMGPAKAKTFLRQLRAHAATQVELAAKGLKSAAALTGECEQIPLFSAPERMAA